MSESVKAPSGFHGKVSTVCGTEETVPKLGPGRGCKVHPVSSAALITLIFKSRVWSSGAEL